MQLEGCTKPLCWLRCGHTKSTSLKWKMKSQHALSRMQGQFRSDSPSPNFRWQTKTGGSCTKYKTRNKILFKSRGKQHSYNALVYRNILHRQTIHLKLLTPRVSFSFLWLQASVAVKMKSSFLWNVTQGRLLVIDVSEKPTDRIFKGQIVLDRMATKEGIDRLFQNFG